MTKYRATINANNEDEQFFEYFTDWVVNLTSSQDPQNRNNEVEVLVAEDSKRQHNNLESSDSTDHQVWYNLKKITDKKNLQEIEDLIFDELGIEDNPIYNWNKLVRRIAGISFQDPSDRQQEDLRMSIEDGNNNHSNVLPDPLDLLINRNKCQRLTYDQKKVIYNQIKQQHVPLKIIEDKYLLSSSTIKRILTLFSSNWYNEAAESNKLGRKIFKSKLVKKVASHFIFRQEAPFRSKDVCRHIEERLGISIKSGTMAKFMKEDLSLSFKKGSSRPVALDVK